MLINAAIVILGFWAPWMGLRGEDQRIPALEWLALHLSRLNLLPFTTSAHVVILAGALVAGMAVVLRVSGSAYLGPGAVISPAMQADAITIAGPYRYVRNPLYVGLWCMVVAMALFMPPTGALAAIVLITIFLFRLILAEEYFLSARLGEPYRNYLLTTPRLIPRLRTSLPDTDSKMQWVRALLSELTPIGVFIALALLSWSYDNTLMIRVILVAFGASLVARAFMPRNDTLTDSTT
jgi:protein-S-isoprenylcysteine O-methyltransferase Ste14